jgi:hypothetical protein
MTIWVGTGAAVWHRRTEELLARFVYRLRSLSELEKRRILELDADAASYGGAGGTRTHDPGIMRAMAIPTLANFRLR